MHILDNKASDKFKNKIKKNCRIQLVSPDTHQRKLAEQAIQTFKNHFKAIIQGLDKTFPMKLWDNDPHLEFTEAIKHHTNCVGTPIRPQSI
jgi:hypothetical protein